MSRKTLIEQVDLAVAKAVAPLRRHPAVESAGAASELADQPPMIILCLTVLVGGLVSSNPKLARTGGRMLAAEVLATLIKRAIKHSVTRTRPFVIDDGGDYRMGKGRDRSSAMSSFPSGHTAGAVAVALAAAREYPQAKVATLAAAGAVAAIQIPRCKHFVSDVGAGAIVGVAAATLIFLGESLMRQGVTVVGSRSSHIRDLFA